MITQLPRLVGSACVSDQDWDSCDAPAADDSAAADSTAKRPEAGLSEVRRVLDGLVAVAAQCPEARVGLYLHGSRARGEERVDSDVDILGLCDPSTPTEAIDALKQAGRALAAGLPQRLDFKVFRASRFAEDPWVQLDRAVFLGGVDWRAYLPVPSFDEQAREALLAFRFIVGDHGVDSADEPRMKKILGWFASVAAAQTTGVCPPEGPRRGGFWSSIESASEQTSNASWPNLKTPPARVTPSQSEAKSATSKPTSSPSCETG